MSYFYEINLGVFAIGNAFLLYRQYRGPKPAEPDYEQLEDRAERAEVNPAAVRRFQLEYFLVYGLAVAADWFQGPHIYAIYKYEKEIPEKWVAALYAAGFISGGVSASFAGELADRYGRRLACLVYCVLYTLTCLSMFSNDLTVLFLGRLCGGVCTTLLYSVFETWMITEYHDRGLQGSGLTLSSIFGYMTTLSCVVAIACGVLGDVLVAELGGRVWPFVASIVCSIGAGCLIMKTWVCLFTLLPHLSHLLMSTQKENYGSKSAETNSLQDIKTGVTTILKDKRIFSLGIASCFFEGTMYLFIFFWSAALKSARLRSGSEEDLPYGLIFSSFMCSMMAGSAVFSLFAPSHSKESASFILLSVILTVSICLSGAVLLEDERLLFWVMCLLELCIGAYYPSMSFLKSEVVEDGVRGRVYSILRFPLNVLVVITHSLDEEGDAHRNHVFMTLAAFLLLAFFVVKRCFSG